jgi:hypothetical protein
MGKITNSWAAVLAAAPNVGAAEQFRHGGRRVCSRAARTTAFYRADDDVWLSVDALDEVIAAERDEVQ